MVNTPVPVNRSDQFNLRLPEGMRGKIAESAKRNGRSINSELVALIQTGMDTDCRVLAAIGELKNSVDMMNGRLAALESQLVKK